MISGGEPRLAQWKDFGREPATWEIPAAGMKREKAGKINGEPHLVSQPSKPWSCRGAGTRRAAPADTINANGRACNRTCDLPQLGRKISTRSPVSVPERAVSAPPWASTMRRVK